MNVLFVEDSGDDEILVRRLLIGRWQDLRLKRVYAEDDLCASLDSGAWDVVLSDLNLPGFSGISALRMVRQRRPELPFIMISDAVSGQVAMELKASGVRECLLKSEMHRLVEVIQQEVSGRERASEAGQCPVGILVVEDEQPLRKLVGMLLRRRGYQVFEADSGRSALGIWKEKAGSIDLLLTDMIMPEGLNGLELAGQLMAEKPGLKVVFTSGYSASLIQKDILMPPGTNFLAKPYTPQRLSETIHAALHDPSPIHLPAA